MNILVNLVADVDKQLSEELDYAKVLTKYAVAYRYPEENEPPEKLTQKSCEKIVEIANNIYMKLNSSLSGISED